MTVLVTGATGFVGANLTRRLVSEKYDTHILIRKSSNTWRLSDALNKLKIHYVDVTDLENLKKVVGSIDPKVVFHLASSGLYAGVSSPPAHQLKVNTIGTLNLVEALMDVNYKCLVITGSSAEYGPKKTPMKETDTAIPTTFYGVTKLTSTLFSQMAAKTFAKPIVVLRLFSPFGPYDDKSRLIPYVISQALRSKPVYLGRPDSVRDFIFIEDIVDSFLKSIPRASTIGGEVINIGSGRQRSVSQIVEKIINITGSKSKIFWNKQKARPQESPMWQADITLAKSKLGWQPRYSQEEGLRKTVTWFSKNLNHY